MDREIKKHPSYAMIDIGRTTGRCDDLFGTSIEHNSTIRLRIKRADHQRHLNHDWYHSYENLIEVEMSALQWAEAITNMNGSGTPCTLRYYNKDVIVGEKIDNKRVQIDKEFDDRVKSINKDVNKLINEATTILNSKTIKASDRNQLTNLLNRISQDLNQNIPFIKEQFTEQMDKTVSEAKCEVESFVAQKIHSLGLESLEQLRIDGGNK